MRTFWIMLGILVLVGIAFAIAPVLRSGSSTPAMNSPPVAEWPGKKDMLNEKKPDSTGTSVAKPVNQDAGDSATATTAAAVAAPKQSTKEAPKSEPAVSSPTPATDIAVTGTAAQNAEKKTAPSEASTSATSGTDTKQPAADQIKKEEAAVDDVIEKALGGGSAAPADAGEKKVELKQTPVKIDRKSDSEVLLDGTFTVKGKGTKESPYIAPWELVVAAQETYDPGQKKDEIPGAVMFLDGKHVRLTGYVCFPMYVPEPKEMLSMLNQWDGCCIGVPPTPYDAIEVHLAKKVSTDDRYAAYGTVEGVFRVKPYLSGNWLVGLYLLEEATFKPSDKGGGS